ncbi:hypothetical protein K456DRAFT_1662443 [Colletotrichum gloeosporioides 23]|nr:hypothetical protein K456DRAFT_1662443 [Colletotrichum gloeosporioides 23]
MNKGPQPSPSLTDRFFSHDTGALFDFSRFLPSWSQPRKRSPYRRMQARYGRHRFNGSKHRPTDAPNGQCQDSRGRPSLGRLWRHAQVALGRKATAPSPPILARLGHRCQCRLGIVQIVSESWEVLLSGLRWAGACIKRSSPLSRSEYIVVGKRSPRDEMRCPRFRQTTPPIPHLECFTIQGAVRDSVAAGGVWVPVLSDLTPAATIEMNRAGDWTRGLFTSASADGFCSLFHHT